MISLSEARERVARHAGPALAAEQVPLDAALGRRLACPVRAEQPWPTTDRAAMDGFGVAAGAAGLRAGTELVVIGEGLAGRPFVGAVVPGEAVRIMTGAVVPTGVDAVVPVEHTSGFGGARVTLAQQVRAGANIRPRGSEVAAGALLLEQGRCLRAAEIGALAVLGFALVPVHRRPRVAIVSTGDEIVPIERTPADHQLRDSNSHALAAQVRECGAEPVLLGIARDEPNELRAKLEQGLATADALLTIGGVSKGTHDLVQGTLAALGVREMFHGIALKPGKPTFFGVREGDGRLVHVFGLPGNPASCFTVFDLLVAPLLQARAGARAPAAAAVAVLGGAPFRANARLQALPARLRVDGGGILRAVLSAERPSGDPFGMLDGDGYALVPAAASPADTRTVPIVPYSGAVMQP
jgi:molybdopterin molybdotransferase